MISLRLKAILEEVGLYDEEMFTQENCVERDRFYLDIATNCESFSYIKADRLNLFEGDYYNESLRKKYATQTKPGRLIGWMLGRELSYPEARKLRARMFNSDNYEIITVKGDDIAKYYMKDTYEQNKGTLGSSCMAEVPSNFFQLYKDYARMVIVRNKNTGDITARSIIFDNVESGVDMGRATFLSRIYSTDDAFEDMIKDWARALGYYVFCGNYANREIITPEGEFADVAYFSPFIRLCNNAIDSFAFLPYIDNFKCHVVLQNGECFLTPEEEFPSRYEDSEILDYEVITSIAGGYGYGFEDNYCIDCSFNCRDCFKYVHGYGEEEEYNPCEECDSESCEDCSVCDFCDRANCRNCTRG